MQTGRSSLSILNDFFLIHWQLQSFGKITDKFTSVLILVYMVAKPKQKPAKVFQNYMEFEDNSKQSLQNTLFYCSHDSFEFELIVNVYRNALTHRGEPLEVIVFVAEPGDLERLFAELTNLSMFSSLKLIIIKAGQEFFKPILAAKNKTLYASYKRNFQEISDKTFLLVHYDAKDVPDRLFSVFGYQLGYLKNRNYYPNERRKALDSVLRHEKVSMQPAAMDEFLYKVSPNMGSYMKSIQKLKLLLGKKQFSLEDVEEALFNRSDFNPFHMADLLFQNDRREFFKEFSKLNFSEDNKHSFLSLLTALLNRTDEVRKAKLLFHRLKGDDGKTFQLLGMSSYSDKRKAFVRNKLTRETKLFQDQTLDDLYALLTELNIRFKTGIMASQAKMLFTEKMLGIFHALERN
ncbi:MAG: DNA polymerase III subunit delta [Spirochaetota bacterium]